MSKDATHTPLNITKGRITDATYKISNVLGYRFPADVYRNALTHELQKMGSIAKSSAKVDIYYDGVVVGHYEVDLLVDDDVAVLVQTEADPNTYTASMFRHLLFTTGQKLGAMVNFSAARPDIQFVTGRS